MFNFFLLNVKLFANLVSVIEGIIFRSYNSRGLDKIMVIICNLLLPTRTMMAKIHSYITYNIILFWLSHELFI